MKTLGYYTYIGRNDSFYVKCFDLISPNILLQNPNITKSIWYILNGLNMTLLSKCSWKRGIIHQAWTFLVCCNLTIFGILIHDVEEKSHNRLLKILRL